MAKRTRKGKVIHVTVPKEANLTTVEGMDIMDLAFIDGVSMEILNVEYEDHAEKKLTQPKGIDMGDGCYMVAGGPIASGVTRNTQRAAKWLRK